MRLSELKPKYGATNGERTHVIFDCPKCREHKIAVPFAGEGLKWDKTGDDFETLSLAPSIRHKEFIYDDIENDPTKGHYCESHFFITNGEIRMCE